MKPNILIDIAAEGGRKIITPRDVLKSRTVHGNERTRRALVLLMGGEHPPGIAIENVHECCLEANRE